MGQSSSQAATQLVDEPEAIEKLEKRKRSKKRKGKKAAGSGGHAEQEEEEEIAQALLEMKGFQAREDILNSDDNDIAAAHQLLAESSPAGHGASAMPNGGPVQSHQTSKAKLKSKRNKNTQKDQSSELGVGVEVHSYVEDLLGTSSRAAEKHVNGSRRDPQVFGSSSMAVPSLDDMDSNDENIAPYLKEYDRLTAIAEPTTPTSHDEGETDPEPTQSQPLTSSMGEKRKRKRRRDTTGSATAVTGNVSDRVVAGTEPSHESPQPEHQANRTISLPHPDAGSGSERDAVMDSINQRQVSPDLYNVPLDPVLPGIEDPTSPSYKARSKRGKKQGKRASAGSGDRQSNSSVSNNQEPELDLVSGDGLSRPSTKAASKRKRPVPADDSVDHDTIRPKKKKKKNSTDYKTAQTSRVGHGPVLNRTEAEPKVGPFTEAEIAKLFAFRDQYCEENNCTQQQFIKQIHANAHNNVVNIRFWNEVSEVLPSRTRHALQRVCRRRFHNFTKRGTWTAEEDQELREAHNEHGNSWKVIGEQIERLAEDCRDRWRNYLKESEFRNRDEWTENEVDLLKVAVAESMDAMRKANRERKRRLAAKGRTIGQQNEEEKDVINWVIVSEKLGGARSRLQCSYKWRALEATANNRKEKLRKVVQLGSKGLRQWRKKHAEKMYPYMLPGDKYELLNALSQLGVLTDDSCILWTKVGDDSFRSVWTGAACKYAYFQMKETISSFADVMPFDEIINTLKEQLEEEHPTELDMHYVPTAENVEKSGKKSKSSSKSKKKTKNQNLSTETVAESDPDNHHTDVAPNGDDDDGSREQSPTTAPEAGEADDSIDEVPDTQTSPEMEVEAEAEAETETESNGASSGTPDTDDDADKQSTKEPEIADSDLEGRTRTPVREIESDEGEDEDEDEDEEEEEEEEEGEDAAVDVDEQLASKVMLLRDA